MKALFLNEDVQGVVSGEKTFWSVLAESVPDSEVVATKFLEGDIDDYIKVNNPSIVVLNSIIGDIKTPPGVKKIVFLQDNFKLMKKILPTSFRDVVKNIIYFGRKSYAAKIKKQEKAIAAANAVVAVSVNLAHSYNLSNAAIIPIGTDARLFSPLDNREELKIKYGLPSGKKIKVFVGSTHKVKGFDVLKKEIKNDPESFYVLVLKDKFISGIKFPNAKIFQRISQDILVELYNCADLYVGRSRVETLWLAPIEAMFCGIPIDVRPVGIFADWRPENKNPRAEAFLAGLDSKTMIQRWQKLLKEI